MTYPQGYTPPAPPKTKPKYDLKPTQSDLVPLEDRDVSKWHDTTTMDDHVYDYEKEKWQDPYFRSVRYDRKTWSKKKSKLKESKKRISLFKKIMLKLKILEVKEVK